MFYKKSLVCLVVVAALIASVSSQLYDTVDTQYGPLRGRVRSGVRSFLGVPFAQPPVGDLRWASPKRASSWGPEVRDALDPADMCPGSIQALIDIIPRVDADEDCLYLNVWTPTEERITKPLPVMFWIYGGAFILGDGYELGLYSGEYIVSTRDVIIVTHNYRLGALGFAVIDDSTNGNYAIEDQRLALQWVIENIANFGGDPKNIMIFGESAGAGAMSVGIHLTSPLSRGMFQKAILHSNAASLNFKTREQALKSGGKLARLVDCNEGDVACMRNVTWQKISFLHIPVYPAGAQLLVGDILEWGPVIDNKNLLRHPLDSFAMGDFAQVPMVWGTNSDEMTLFQDLIVGGIELLGKVIGNNMTLELGPVAYNLLINLSFRDKADMVKDRYPPSLRNDNMPLFAKVITEYVFRCSSRRAALDVTKYSTSPVYTYEFSHVPEFLPVLGELGSDCFSTSACHAIELPYIFHPERILGLINLSDKFTDGEEYMSQKMIDYWVSFSIGSNPNLLKPPVDWPLFNVGSQKLLDISPTYISRDWDNDCDFWDQVGYDY